MYPVQRPPRYKLLLIEVIKTLPPDSTDLPKLQQSLDELCEAIAGVDKDMEIFEEACKMAELSPKIIDFDMYSNKNRHLYFEGHAVKFSRKWTNERYIVILSDVLLILEPAKVLINSFKINKDFPSGEYMIADVADLPPFINAIDIRQKDKSFRANLDSPDDKHYLLEGYQKMLKFNDISPATIERRGFAPVWIPDSYVPNCMICNSQFSVFNRRHHCRNCGDCICSNCSKHKIVLPFSKNVPLMVCNKCYEDQTLKNNQQ